MLLAWWLTAGLRDVIGKRAFVSFPRTGTRSAGSNNTSDCVTSATPVLSDCRESVAAVDWFSEPLALSRLYTLPFDSRPFFDKNYICSFGQICQFCQIFTNCIF